ncbi:hypothetical protein [Rhodococcus qingshengii]|uniref:hypothetical protein n=1 Tax=Rhodococcus qingshengii TaxID=334542 RepID=UPI001ADF45A3|nr:hypothetical protein [Rhodococcus qingshengii]MCQ4150253.1 hypothetical protein [Rhodococcus qingshengii]
MEHIAPATGGHDMANFAQLFNDVIRNAGEAAIRKASDALAADTTVVTLEFLAEAVRDALVDETATYRIRDAAKLGLDEAEVNLAHAKRAVLHAEHALREFISGGSS